MVFHDSKVSSIHFCHKSNPVLQSNKQLTIKWLQLAKKSTQSGITYSAKWEKF